MMQLVETQTMLTIDEGEFRARFPTTVFPAVLTPDSLEGTGFALFQYADRPVDTPCTTVATGAWSGPDSSGVYTMNWTVEKLPLAQCQSNLLGLAAQQCHQALQQVTTFNNVPFPLDRSFIAAGMATTTFPVAVKGLNNQWLSLSQTDLQKLVQQVSNAIVQIVNNEYAHYTAIMALTTFEAAQTYDVTTGWTVT